MDQGNVYVFGDGDAVLLTRLRGCDHARLQDGDGREHAVRGGSCAWSVGRARGACAP